MSILILYALHEDNENVQFFFRHGVCEQHLLQHGLRVMVIINGEQPIANLPETPCCQVLRRENHGLDFEAWGAGLDRCSKDSSVWSLSSFQHFIFLNSTVRGPFLTTWALDAGIHWWECFICKLSADCKLVGTTINVHVEGPHVQSMLLTTDHTGLTLAQQHNLFRRQAETEDKTAFVSNREIGWSKLILQAGFNIACLQLAYRNVDFRLFGQLAHRNVDFRLFGSVGPTTSLGQKKLHELLQANRHVGGDPCYEGAAWGSSLDPYEVIFIKTNRNISPCLLQNLTRWSNNNRFHDLVEESSKGSDPATSFARAVIRACWQRNSIPTTMTFHFERLSLIASECRSIAEFGCGPLVATFALLDGLARAPDPQSSTQEKKKTQESYFLAVDTTSPAPERLQLAHKLAAECGIAFKFVCENSIKVSLTFGTGDTCAKHGVDLLLIDSLHTFAHLSTELERHHTKVGRYLVITNTEPPWSVCDEPCAPGWCDYSPEIDRQKRGLKAAVTAFLEKNHAVWFQRFHDHIGHGLTVLQSKT